MKKKILLALALLGAVMQSASAAPTGWYSLSETWRDGSFTGKFHYDGAAPERVTHITGVLTDLAQSTAIHTVWSGEKPPGATWTFVHNALPGIPDAYDAGFYLNLVDLGATLALDTSADNGLYDWSGEFAWFVPEQLNGSPLLSYAIAPVPEPDALAMISLALVGGACARRRFKA